MSPRVWYKSLYWRIAVGFVVLLATLLGAQMLLFLWLTGRFVTSPSSRTPQQLADQVARDLSTVLTDDPSIDLQAHVVERFGEVRLPFVVVMRDGRRVSNRPGVLPRGFPGGPGGRGRPPDRPEAGEPGPPPFPEPRREGQPPDGREPVGPPPDAPPRDGPPPGWDDRPRRGGGGRGPGAHVSAPIVVSDARVGFVAVPSAPPPVSVLLRELGPTLTWSGLALLAVGAVVTAALIFRPAHKRLRSLEEAARALGEGRTDVRAGEAGGDEVAALASAFNRMATDLDARAVALAKSDQARRQLLADVSHELMTPLTAIRGYVETLAMPALAADDSTRRRYLDIVEQETHKLEAIIGDLLDLARLEGGGGNLVMESVPVSELFRRVVDRHEPVLRSRRITMDVAVAPADLDVRADANRLEQALQNIAANAIRHTPDGGRLELRGERRGDRIRLAVRDTGTGIPPEHLPHVFDRFYKADPARVASTQSGSGLGLSIVRAIVERHGGTVTAFNAPEGGALFEVMLPVSDFAPPSSKQ
jgi:two-component system sensor histidine kinase BaeS